MRKILRLLALYVLMLLPAIPVLSNTYSSTRVYLITCSAGSETYSMYGHSAIRIVDSISGVDAVYNWGVFDFNTPNFTYKFARGRLDYMLGVYSYESFLNEYLLEERSVISQQINLTDQQLYDLKVLLNENAKPENRYYRYDFFMDNCATRIRDIIEKVVGDILVYPEQPSDDIPTFRDRINEFQGGDFVWLDVGIDLLLGTPADNPCGFRESMFLPDYLMSNLSQAIINSEGWNYPLLGPPVTVLSFDAPSMEVKFLKRPWFILSIIVALLLFVSFSIQNRMVLNIFDTFLFTLFFILSFLMIFTNYLTDHQAMHTNFNMVWLNPLLLLLPVIAIMRTPQIWFWRAQIFLVLVFMVLIVFIKQAINPAFIPLMLLLIARSWYRLNTPG